MMHVLIEGFGWVGSFLLAFCAMPQAWMSWRQGHSNGVAPGLLWLWGGGEVFTLFYAIGVGSFPLILNYGVNIFTMGIIIWFKVNPRLRDQVPAQN